MVGRLLVALAIVGGGAGVVGAGVVVVVTLGGCAGVERSGEAATASAMRRVLLEDAELGGARNEATHRVSLGEASRRYAAALREIDCSGTPVASRRALADHASAWEAFGEAADGIAGASEVRGEMHGVIERLEAGADREGAELLRRRLDLVWATWDEVVSASAVYGVDANDPG